MCTSVGGDRLTFGIGYEKSTLTGYIVEQEKNQRDMTGACCQIEG